MWRQNECMNGTFDAWKYYLGFSFSGFLRNFRHNLFLTKSIFNIEVSIRIISTAKFLYLRMHSAIKLLMRSINFLYVFLWFKNLYVYKIWDVKKYLVLMEFFILDNAARVNIFSLQLSYFHHSYIFTNCHYYRMVVYFLPTFVEKEAFICILITSTASIRSTIIVQFKYSIFAEL